jgi:hypothetical protein
VAPSDFLRERARGLPEWRWHGVQALAEAAWMAVGPMLVWWSLPIWTAVVGIAAFAWLADARPLVGHPLALAGALLLAGVVHVGMHELGHAMAVVASGRRVRYAAVGLGGFYVDSTDLFLGTRAQHARASLAGPAATVLVTAFFALAAAAAPIELAGPLRLGVYAGGGVLALTLYPFAFDNDARRAWADLAGEPGLGPAAFRAVAGRAATASQWLYVAGALGTPLLAWWLTRGS